MSNWTSGYVTDITYTHGYYPELNPVRYQLALISAGFVAPQTLNVCELGFGQGVSTAMHAAAQADVAYWGTDFNPSQAAHARNLSAVSGANCHLYDQSFEEFCQRDDLPEFDFISLHGIWSWISDENREIIVNFVRRKLRVGGVLYISYNTQPGWAAAIPMRHLLTQHAEQMGAKGDGIVSRVNGATDFFKKFLAVNPGYIKANPQIEKRFEKLLAHDPAYLAHEYFNRDWEPMHFATMVEWLSPAKLGFACSSNLVDHVPALNLSPEQQVFMAEIADVNFKETLRDMIANQQFRRDYWIKGLQPLNAIHKSERLLEISVVLTQPRKDVSLKVQGVLGEGDLHEKFYGPILDVLADYAPRTLAAILESVANYQTTTLVQITEAVLLLIAKGTLSIAQSAALVAKSKVSTDKLNHYLMELARGNTNITYLASPVTGGALHVGAIEQLYLLALHQGKASNADIVAFTWEILSNQGRRIIKDGNALASVEENKIELTALVEQFVAVRLPMLRALGIA